MRLLVANRAEIACRVFQACRELGIETIGIVAPEDEQARHVTYCDYLASVPSYLDADSIVLAAKEHQATLLHPGYGFLSERAHFARAVEAAGIRFLGPRADTLESLGDKIAAKALAERIGVPTLPWMQWKRSTDAPADLERVARELGFPLLVKASAGGGGKGMRLVRDAVELSAAVESASAEALSAFGDGTLFLERFVVSPRHVEAQVLGDGAGQAVALGERECSLQRRHQKIWEEAPAPNLPQATREAILAHAETLAQEARYRGAGTVEFLVDPENRAYFLEMNARLQVEHPVTEETTGIDLVHEQLRLAMDPVSYRLPARPEPRGHSIEARLYAEDPSRGFAPAPGRVSFLSWPTGAGIRVESGIETGQEIGTSFDSLLAKLVVRAGTREAAIARLRFALEETRVLGIGTNQAFLRALCDTKEVREARWNVNWLDSIAATLVPPPRAAELQALGETLVASPTQNWVSGARFPSPWISEGRT